MDGLRLTRTYDLLNELIDDVHKSFEILEENKDSQYLKRVTVRTVFSFIESIPQIIKYELRKDIIKNKKFIAISKKEEEFLNERKIKNTREVKLNIPIDKNIKETFKLAIKIWKLENFSINTDKPQYQEFLNAKNTRNRLTHPKKFHDVMIEDIEMSSMAEAFLFCRDNFSSLMKEKSTNILKTLPEKYHESMLNELQLN